MEEQVKLLLDVAKRYREAVDKAVSDNAQSNVGTELDQKVPPAFGTEHLDPNVFNLTKELRKVEEFGKKHYWVQWIVKEVLIAFIKF